MSRPQQSFILDQRDLARARTAALTAGVSLNAWMRRAMRSALDGEASAAVGGAPATIDTAALDAIAQRLDALVGRHEAGTTAGAAVVENLRKTGRAFQGLLDQQLAASTTKPTAPVARAAAPAPRAAGGLDEVRLSDNAR